MSLLGDIATMFLDGIGPIDVQARHASEFPSFEEQMAVIRNRYRQGTWRYAGVDDALGNPAIFGAVTLIANTVGSLSMEAYRRGIRLQAEDSPRLIQRPNPFSTPRDFWRDTAFYMATRGEAWWWISVRDPLDNSPMSLYPIPPWEVMLEPTNDRLRPIIRWGDRIMRNEDMRQLTYLPGRDGRGKGPLQVCDAAVSVAVESEAWAANFFSGSIPSMIGTTDQDMTPDELAAMDRQWNEKPPNMPRWLTNGLTMSESPFSPEKAQLTDVRNANVGDAARMFTIPGPLLEYQMSGSSLTYRNDETIWTDFARRCLSPNYLEPIEQTMSDLLTRSMAGRFNTKQLTRASAKERMEIHNLAIPLGIYDAAVAAQEEGYAPGNVDYAPVPSSPPQAFPTRLPVDRDSLAPPPVLTVARTALADVRCPKCSKLAGRVSGAAEIKCERCGTIVRVAA